MTKQSSIAEQIANITNSVKALELLQQLRDIPLSQTIQSITVTLGNGTVQTFIKAPDSVESDESDSTEDVRVTTKQYGRKVYRGFVEPVITTPTSTETHDAWSTRITFPPRVGLHCEIDGVKYNSVAAAAREINLHPSVVSKRIKSIHYPTWKLI